jgi:hypothetical protein
VAKLERTKFEMKLKATYNKLLIVDYQVPSDFSENGMRGGAYPAKPQG